MTAHFAARARRGQLDILKFAARPPFCFHRAMPKNFLAAIVAHCDQILRTREIADYENAANGLQIENSGAVTKIAAAVDASLTTVKMAVAARADLLIVHHGIFWNSRQPWTEKIMN